MRISTNTIYQQGLSALQDRMATLLKTQQKIALGRNIVTPSDDPVGSVRALDLGQTLGVTQQYKTNMTHASVALKLEETVLAGVENVLTDVKQIAIGAGDPPPAASTLQALATEVRGRYQELLSLANTKDAQGQYMFAGFKGATQPFTQLSGPGVYAGDEGQRSVQISSSRQIAISDPGKDVFKPGIAGQDVFQTLDDLSTQLSTGTITSASLSTIITQLNTALSNVQVVHGSVTGRLHELQSSQETNTQTTLQYQSALADIQDLDYTKAITELQQTQTSLEAAQKSYASVQKLSLFNYLP